MFENYLAALQGCCIPKSQGRNLHECQEYPGQTVGCFIAELDSNGGLKAWLGRNLINAM